MLLNISSSSEDDLEKNKEMKTIEHPEIRHRRIFSHSSEAQFSSSSESGDDEFEGLLEKKSTTSDDEGEESFPIDNGFEQVRLPEGGFVINEEEVESIGMTLVRVQNDLSFLKAKFNVQDASVRKPKKDPWLRPWLTNNILLISFLWQVLNLIVLHAIGAYDVSTDDNTEISVDVGLSVMALFQGLHLLLTVVVSIKLVKQVVHRTVSGWFLTQSYLSSVLLFSGIYTLLYRVERDSFQGVLEASTGTSLDLVLTTFRLTYFSITTQTTVGFGDCSPTLWYTELIVSLQQLLSVVYSTVILSLGSSHFQGKTVVENQQPGQQPLDNLQTSSEQQQQVEMIV